MLDITNYLYSQYEKKMKLANKLTNYLNACINLPLHIQPNQNMSMLAENDKKEEYSQSNKGQDVKENQRDLIGKSSNNNNIRDRLLKYFY